MPTARSLRLLRDLRAGEASVTVRVMVSITVAAVLLCLMMVVLGLVDLVTRVRDPHIIAAMGVAAPLWCVAVGWIWSRGAGGRRVVGTVLAILAIWGVVIPLCALIEETLRSGQEEFLLTACVASGVALTTWIVAAAVADARRPRAARRTGLDVACPDCGYALVGLSACRCPECGREFTLDELVIPGSRDRDLEVPSPAEAPDEGPPPGAVQAVSR